MTDALRIEGLRKDFGAHRVLDGVDLTVPDGKIVGFLGQNGAGKTTTLRIVLGLARATSGTVRILGHDVTTATNDVRQQIGFLPDVPGFPPWMRAPEFLRFAGSLFGLRGPRLRGRVDSLLEMSGLAGVEQKIGDFSRGMKQRLGVAQALVNAPRLLLLDEPTSALDPLGRKDVLTMIEALRGKATVVFSTHILSDVERVCDTAAILTGGRVVAEGDVADLRARYGGSTRVLLDVDSDHDAVAERIRRRPWCEAVDVNVDGRIVTSVSDLAAANREIPRIVVDADASLVRYEPCEASLEDVFVQLVGQGPRS